MSSITTALLIECVQEVSERPVAADTDIFTAGVDSLAVLRCRALLKQRTGEQVPAHVFFGGRTPAAIVERLGAQA